MRKKQIVFEADSDVLEKINLMMRINGMTCRMVLQQVILAAPAKIQSLADRNFIHVSPDEEAFAVEY